MIVGIDAINIRGGGGVTHLVEILRAADPTRYGVERVLLWATQSTLDRIEDRPWLEKLGDAALDRGLVARTWWQIVHLPRELRRRQCDVLLVPGGSYTGSFGPAVVMCRNMLPFEWREMRRYGLSWMFLRCALLRVRQSRSFRRADGVIFLTDYAKREVSGVIGGMRGSVRTIPHGVDAGFLRPPRVQRSIEECSPERPFRLVYVSIIDVYKHQWNVLEAVDTLRRENFPVHIDFVGPAYPPALKRFQSAMERLDPNGAWSRYLGGVSHADLPRVYQQCDLFVFASSCENMPNILLEAMAAGVPVACSERGPMPDILGPASAYFDPEKPRTIANAIRRLTSSVELRERCAKSAYETAATFTWDKCASDTFQFVGQIAGRKVPGANDEAGRC